MGSQVRHSNRGNYVKLRVGQSLYSTVGITAVVVIRAPEGEVELTCGGAPMATESAPATSSVPSTDEGSTQLGKRYADDEVGLELLCTKADAGTLAVNGTPIELKDAKPLPASD